MPDKRWTYVNLLLRHATPKVAALQISAINNSAQLTQMDQYNILKQAGRIIDASHPAGKNRVTACYLQETSDWIVGPGRGRRLASDQSLSLHTKRKTAALESSGVRDFRSVLSARRDCGLPCSLALTPNFSPVQRVFRKPKRCQTPASSNRLITVALILRTTRII